MMHRLSWYVNVYPAAMNRLVEMPELKASLPLFRNRVHPQLERQVGLENNAA